MRGLFITGTDTNVGKTVVAAALLHRFRATAPLCYWKPIQTGIEESDDTAVVRRLAACGGSEILDEGIRLPRALSPHLAARLAGKQIDVDRLLQSISSKPGQLRWLVEGAGGVLAPINERHMMADMMSRLALPVLIVARSTLGTINHTLMTVEALRGRLLRIGGVVMVGERNAANREAIESFGATNVIAELPPLSSLTAETLAVWAHAELDPKGLLTEFLT
jgi:dethiobiotin synthetase